MEAKNGALAKGMMVTYKAAIYEVLEIEVSMTHIRSNVTDGWVTTKELRPYWLQRGDKLWCSGLVGAYTVAAITTDNGEVEVHVSQDGKFTEVLTQADLLIRGEWKVSKLF